MFFSPEESMQRDIETERESLYLILMRSVPKKQPKPHKIPPSKYLYICIEIERESKRALSVNFVQTHRAFSFIYTM